MSPPQTGFAQPVNASVVAAKTATASSDAGAERVPIWAREWKILSISPAPNGSLKTAEVQLQAGPENTLRFTAGVRGEELQPWLESVHRADDGTDCKLVFRRAEESAELIAEAALVMPPPSQVEVEARFIEVNETRLRQMQLRRSANQSGDGDALRILMTALRGESRPQPLTASHAEELVGLLTAGRGVNLLSAPRVTTKFGQRAVIEIIREFRYAVEWERNEPRQSWIPTAYETRNTGVTLEVEPETDDAGSMTMRLAPQIVEFLGWRDVDSGRRSRNSAAGKSRVQPAFSARKAETTVTLVDGQTLLFAQLPETENTHPFTSPTSRRRLIVMITPRLVRQ